MMPTVAPLSLPPSPSLPPPPYCSSFHHFCQFPLPPHFPPSSMIMPIKMVLLLLLPISLPPFLPLTLSFFASFANALPVAVTATTATGDDGLLRSLPPELDISRVKDIVPVEASDFFDQLTGRDKQVLREVLAKADTYESSAEVLKDLRNGSSTLYDKAVQLVTSVRSTVAGLSVPARTFVDESVSQLRNAFGDGLSLANLKAQAQQLIARYRRLDPGTREELRNAFPTVASVLDNPVLQTLASGLFDIQTNNNDQGGDDAGESEQSGESDRETEEREKDNGPTKKGGRRGGDRDSSGAGGDEDGTPQQQVEDEVGERAERRLVVHRQNSGSSRRD